MEKTIEVLKGRTLLSIKEVDKIGGLLFTCDDGKEYLMFHRQDCCEGVTLEETIGDLSDLVGTPILEASERTSEAEETSYGVAMWTFYELRTIKGSVTLRWFGESNGCYSIDVDFMECTLEN